MPIKKTHEEFVAQVYELVADEYTVLSQYINAKTKVKIKHNKCNNEYEISPDNFTSKERRCSKCSTKQTRKTQNQFVEEVYKQVGDEYTVLGKYKNSISKIDIRHNVCGNINKVQPSSFLAGSRCLKCSFIIGAKKRAKTQKQFEKEIFDLLGNEYEVIGQYKNYKIKIEMVHKDCGTKFKIRPENIFLKGQKCPKCTMEKFINEQKLAKGGTLKDFKKKVYNLVENEYTVLGKYINTGTKLKMKHNICGHEYMVKPNNFLNNKRCPKCKASKGELAILKWLEERNIKYEHQFTNDDCRSILPLPFDIAVFKEDNSFILIEYNGKQHYEDIGFFNAGNGFKGLQKRDKIKKNYCEQNNIPLLVIPYWDFDNIEKILNEQLLPLNLMKQEYQILTLT